MFGSQAVVERFRTPPLGRYTAPHGVGRRGASGLRVMEREGPTARQGVLEVGKSAELDAAFRSVAEAECRGQPKFSQATCRALARAVVCRSYAPAVLELCHLVRLAQAAGGRGGWPAFFWDGGPATAHGFAGLVRGRGRVLPAGFEATGAVATLAYDDGAFAITWARMPFLSALLEFLVTAIGFRDLDEALRPLLAPQIRRAEVSGVANRLAALLYGWLKEQLPTAQNQGKFFRLIEFMERRAGAHFVLDDLDDAAILEFWCAAAGDGDEDGADFRTYRSVFKSFVRLRQSMRLATDRRAVEDARPIGGDLEAGEVDPGTLDQAIEAATAEGSPLAGLSEPPAATVKFLNKREAALLELPLDCGDEARPLALSLLRAEVFGEAQGRISQALRRKVDAAERDALVAGADATPYGTMIEAWRDLARHLSRALLAALHALLRCRRPEALALMVALGPRIDLQPLRALLPAEADGERVVALHSAALGERVLARIEDAGAVGPELAALALEARRAFRALSRQGFEDDAVEANADAFAAGAESLQAVARSLGMLLARLDAADWNERFEADRALFGRQFALLYGSLP